MANLLKHIHIEEVSGVAEPANLHPGWMLRKSAGESVGERLVRQLEAMGAVRPPKPEPPVIRKMTARAVADEMLTAMRKAFGDEETARRLKADPEFAAKLREMMKP